MLAQPARNSPAALIRNAIRDSVMIGTSVLTPPERPVTIRNSPNDLYRQPANRSKTNPQRCCRHDDCLGNLANRNHAKTRLINPAVYAFCARHREFGDELVSCHTCRRRKESATEGTRKERGFSHYLWMNFWRQGFRTSHHP